MHKRILIPLGYIILSILTKISINETIKLVAPRSYEELVTMNILIFFISLGVFFYVLVAILKKVKDYPALIAFVVLMVLSLFTNGLLSIFTQRGSLAIYTSMTLKTMLIVSHLVVGMVMLSSKRWPSIVSILLFAKIPVMIMSMPLLSQGLVRYLFDSHGSIQVYQIFMSFYDIGLTILTATMLFVLYYNGNEKTEYQRVGERL